MALGAGSGGKQARRYRSSPGRTGALLPVRHFGLGKREDIKPPRVTAPILALVPLARGAATAKYRPASAAPLAGLVSFVPASFRSVALPQAASPLRSIPTVTNCPDRHGQRGTPPRPRGSAYRPGPAIWPRDFVRPKASAIRREAPPVAEDEAIAVIPASFRSLRNSPVRLAPALAKLSGITATELFCPRLRRRTPQPAGSVLASAASHRPSFRFVPSPETWSRWLALARLRLVAVTQSLTRQSVAGASLWGWHGGMLPGPNPTHIVRDPPVIYSGRTGNPETLCWK